MKKYIVEITILVLLAVGCISNALFAEDSTQSPFDQRCSTIKDGMLSVSPASLEFYVNQEQNIDPQPITVTLSGFAFPDCEDANCTKERIKEIRCYYVDSNGTLTNNTSNATDTKCYPVIEGANDRTDDIDAHYITWAENLDFCWQVSPSDQWIKILDYPDNRMISHVKGTGSFTVTVDINSLLDSNALYTSEPTVKQGNIKIVTTVHDPNYLNEKVAPGTDKESIFIIEDNVTTIAGTPIKDSRYAVIDIPVTVYINSLHEAQQQNIATTDWMNLTLNVPVSDGISGALYILAEHPSLAPGQVYAYRIVNGKPQFDLFSSWGNPVAGAEQLYFAQDIQNAPIAIPFSSHSEDMLTVVIPYRDTNIGVSSNDLPNIKAFIPVAFGGGIRLIGMEGDWIIRAVVGDPNDITNYRSWRELLYYVLHVRPISGRWVVTEDLGGESFTYIDNDVVYPLLLNEERGKLSGVWLTPKGQTVLSVNYANPTDGVCKQFAIQGQRVLIDNCINPGKYEIYFTENTIWGPFEYLYRIDYFDVNTGGKIEGQWQYRMAGDLNWSVPEAFSAVTQDLVIPLDPNCNCYQVAGKINGVATQFIVDTGATHVFLDIDDASMYGYEFDDNNTQGANTTQKVLYNPHTGDYCQQGTVSGIIGTSEAYLCTAKEIEIGGVVSVSNVEIVFGQNQMQPLLGMTFLQHVHVTTNASDGTMIISK